MYLVACSRREGLSWSRNESRTSNRFALRFSDNTYQCPSSGPRPNFCKAGNSSCKKLKGSKHGRRERNKITKITNGDEIHNERQLEKEVIRAERSKVTSVHETGYHDMKNKQYPQITGSYMILTGSCQDTNCTVTRSSKHNIPDPGD